MDDDIKQKKRKRTENWSAMDKTLLRQLCAENISEIENKNVDYNTNKMKKETWIKITNAFNSAAIVKREPNQLQLQWKTLKMKAKQADSSYRKELKKTGGGPAPKSPSREDQELIDLMPNEFVVDQNEFDCDGRVQQTLHTSPAYEDLEILEYLDDVKNIDMEHNKSQTESHQSFKKKKPKTDKNSDAAYKRELFELTKQHMIEEHERKMNILRLEEQCRQQELIKLKKETDLLGI